MVGLLLLSRCIAVSGGEDDEAGSAAAETDMEDVVAGVAALGEEVDVASWKKISDL